MSEYNNSNVGSSSCSYARLSSYNKQSPGVTPPVPATTTSGFYIVPAGSSKLSYDTLVKDPNGCGEYPSILAAYGKNAGSCNPKYVQRPCNK